MTNLFGDRSSAAAAPRVASTVAQSQVRAVWIALGAVIFVILLRVVLAYLLPLTDTTEARYGEIARKMVETGDWITPQHDYGVPFWGKPPLSFWLSAIGIEIFGAGEFAPRFLILVSGIAFSALFFHWLRRNLDLLSAWAGTLMLVSSAMYFISMAAVMTDLVLTVCVYVGLIAFWNGCHDDRRRWDVIMFSALGLGLLTKGPLAGVLMLGPIVIWSVLTRRVRSVWDRFRWILGFLLTLAIALPWYIAAEIKTPGFLHYFIVGEYFDRFLVSDWQGDLYGHPHSEPLGTIWLFFVFALLPWVLVVPWAWFRGRGQKAPDGANRELAVFASISAIVPLLLFTFSANIIVPYAVPAIPGAIAAIVSRWPIRDARALVKVSAVAAAAGLFVTVGLLAGVGWGNDSAESHYSQRSVVRAIDARYPNSKAAIYYWLHRDFSAEYYSRGRAVLLDDAPALAKALAEAQANHAPFILVVRRDERGDLPSALSDRLKVALSIGDYTVFEESSAEAQSYPAKQGTNSTNALSATATLK